MEIKNVTFDTKTSTYSMEVQDGPGGAEIVISSSSAKELIKEFGLKTEQSSSDRHILYSRD